MNKFLSELYQNKNVLMLSLSIVYILGLYAFFTESPILFGAIFTVFLVFLVIKFNNLKLPLVYIFLFYFGFFYASYRVKPSDMLFDKAPSQCELSGEISSVPTSNGDGKVKFFFDVDKFNQENVKARVLVTIKTNSPKPRPNQFLIGNHYIIDGKLRKPFTATNPSQFSYDKYLRNFNVYTTFYSKEDKVTFVPQKLSMKNKLMQYLNIKREDVITAHSEYLKSPNIEILGGVVFGDDAIAPPDYIKTSFINSGLLHILAASGMNVGFISSFLLFFLVRLGVPYKLRLVCGILTIIFYALMTGLGASVVRAALMLIFIFLGKLIDRDAHSISLLSFVALLMLLFNPAYINDVGFQLSFIVTFGILISADAVLKYMNRVPLLISSAIFIPIIAQAWVIPIQMFYFNTISVYSVFANILTMPFLSVISFGGFVSSVFALIPCIASFVCKVFDFVLNPCLTGLVFISEFFANLPHSLYITTHPSIIQILLYYLILLAVIYLLKTQNKKVLIPTLTLTLVLALSIFIKIPNNNFEVIAFDVGNADAFLLKTPANKYYMVDTGRSGYNGSKSQAEIIILKYLKDKGIKNIDGIILTHFDADHAGGAEDIIYTLKVKKVYVNSLVDKKPIAKYITKAINRKSMTEKVLVKDGDIICKENNFEMKVIKPDISKTDFSNSDNENSIIMLTTYGKNKMLFTGDAGVRALSRVDLPKDITVFKVGHHGARGVVDKKLMTTLNPKASLISVGFNKYGHPSPVTVKILEKSKVFRTDKANAIRVIFKPDNTYELDGFNPKTHKFYKRLSGSS